MELGEVKYWITIFKKFLNEHPELCPHDDEWICTDEKGVDAYVCKICGLTMRR